MSQGKPTAVCVNAEIPSKRIPVKLSFSQRLWGLLINGVLVDGKDIVKTRVETGTTKQAFILKTKIPLTQLLQQGSEGQFCPVVQTEERR